MDDAQGAPCTLTRTRQHKNKIYQIKTKSNKQQTISIARLVFECWYRNKHSEPSSQDGRFWRSEKSLSYLTMYAIHGFYTHKIKQTREPDALIQARRGKNGLVPGM